MKRTLFKTVSDWLSELMIAVPPKIRPTLLELLVGAIIAKSGHITNLLLAINPEKHWTTYYKAIERATFQWHRIVKKLLALLLSLFDANKDIILAVDDTVVLRSSEKAPGAGIHHNHAKKKNTPSFVLGQLFVAIFFIASDALGHHHALPLAMHLVSKKGNASKLRIARFLTWVACLWLKESKKNIILLCDSWYAKGPFFEQLAQIGCQCIGQVRRDTALFLQPNTRQGRGRPRKYGQKIDRNDFHNMAPEQKFTANAYGREGVFHYHEFKAMARFLGGRLCKAVWCRFEAKNKSSG